MRKATESFTDELSPHHCFCKHGYRRKIHKRQSTNTICYTTKNFAYPLQSKAKFDII